MKYVGFWLVLLAVCATAGCGGGNDKYDVVTVTGTVTLDDQPVEGAAVSFSPQSKEGVAAAGTTDANGEYTLQTAGVSKRGAVVGAYKVTVIKQVHTETSSSDKKQSGGSPPVMSPSVTTESKNVLPMKYANPAQSGLEAEITESGPNTFDFELKSK